MGAARVPMIRWRGEETLDERSDRGAHPHGAPAISDLAPSPTPLPLAGGRRVAALDGRRGCAPAHPAVAELLPRLSPDAAFRRRAGLPLGLQRPHAEDGR